MEPSCRRDRVCEQELTAAVHRHEPGDPRPRSPYLQLRVGPRSILQLERQAGDRHAHNKELPDGHESSTRSARMPRSCATEAAQWQADRGLTLRTLISMSLTVQLATGGDTVRTVAVTSMIDSLDTLWHARTRERHNMRWRCRRQCCPAPPCVLAGGGGPHLAMNLIIALLTVSSTSATACTVWNCWRRTTNASLPVYGKKAGVFSRGPISRRTAFVHMIRTARCATPCRGGGPCDVPAPRTLCTRARIVMVLPTIVASSDWMVVYTTPADVRHTRITLRARTRG